MLTLPAAHPKTRISSAFRRLGLLNAADFLQFLLQSNRLRKKNRAFRKTHPGFAFPPAYLAYESYGMDLELYYQDGPKTAKWLIGHFGRHVSLEAAEVLDWGCGPARVIRHFPALLPAGREFHGSDYNHSTIKWCQEKIPGVAFGLNGLKPPLAYPAGKFRVVYGISVLTHLSGDLQGPWVSEVRRVMRTDGICFLTTHGDCFRDRLSEGERSEYDLGRFVERGKVKNGHRTFTTFHPPAFMERLLKDSGLEKLEHIPGSLAPGASRQDIWIARYKDR